MTLESCTHKNQQLGRFIFDNGMAHVGVRCENCGLPIPGHFGSPGHWAGAKWLEEKGISKDDLPILRDDRKLRPCHCCGEFRVCELHHCAPKEYFGDEAERWPIVWACAECHDRYHRRFGRPIRRREAA